ncbi:malonate decarboxylase holo-ACP synthase [Niallia taxi]|uniref:malonate decarboxylase holo-ACP synthase n=1 Tax=Niallia taxi TaxID=2499688 RepID=UPI0015F7768E|nr:malonate decarboxylase holo-ACP synthase [Niallia taxi]MCM3216895.1 malonate decarboxylase holo-ACP synthase [Niallia taxi]MED4039791.1 malonate decarboxylase holo-ACP synthase [Niallia taxi]
MVIQPHDLLKVSDLSHLQWKEDNEWVTASLRNAPFVVVRRAEQTNDFIPVGIRGEQRNQRQAAILHRNGIEKIITPYMLAQQKSWNLLNAQRRELPVLKRIDKVAEIMGDWQWGPTGSAGFEIATGYPAIKDTSDLDIVIYAPHPINRNEAVEVLEKLDSLPILSDIQIETNNGAFLLREWINKRTDSMILRTQKGPELVYNPW